MHILISSATVRGGKSGEELDTIALILEEYDFMALVSADKMVSVLGDLVSGPGKAHDDALALLVGVAARCLIEDAGLPLDWALLMDRTDLAELEVADDVWMDAMAQIHGHINRTIH